MEKATRDKFLKRCFQNFSSLNNVNSSYLRPCPRYELLLNLLGYNSLTTKQFLSVFVNLGNVTLAEHTGKKNQFFLHLIPVLGELKYFSVNSFYYINAKK